MLKIVIFSSLRMKVYFRIYSTHGYSRSVCVGLEIVDRLFIKKLGWNQLVFCEMSLFGRYTSNEYPPIPPTVLLFLILLSWFEALLALNSCFFKPKYSIYEQDENFHLWNRKVLNIEFRNALKNINCKKFYTDIIY